MSAFHAQALLLVVWVVSFAAVWVVLTRLTVDRVPPVEPDRPPVSKVTTLPGASLRVDVSDGLVLAVWFRSEPLPFRQVDVDPSVALPVPNEGLHLVRAVEFAE